MEIKKFNETNFPKSLYYTPKQMLKNATKYEDLAIKAGYNIGDTVYNSVASRRMVITQKNDPRVSNPINAIMPSTGFCTLGAVGEHLDVFTKIESINDAGRNKLYHIENLKKSISETYSKALLSKEELKTLVIDYINKL